MTHGNICPENIMVAEINKVYDLKEYKDAEF